jgi:hypothetical protein
VISWKQQGAAVVGSLEFTDGRQGNAVLVGARQNPKGAVILFSTGPGEHLKTIPLYEALDMLHPGSVVEIICMQELAYGKGQPRLQHETTGQM